MSSTQANNINGATDDTGIVQRLPWSFVDHYSSLHSFTTNILNSSSAMLNNQVMAAITNMSHFIQQSILTDLSSAQVRINTHH